MTVENLNFEIIKACKQKNPDKILESLNGIYNANWFDAGCFGKVISARLASIIELNKLVDKPFTYLTEFSPDDLDEDYLYGFEVLDPWLESIICMFIKLIRFCVVSSIDGYHLWLSELSDEGKVPV